MSDNATGGTHRELFHAERFHEESDFGTGVTVSESSDGHLYPIGGRHECDASDCPASHPDTPATTLGTAGPIEMMWSDYFDIQPQTALKRWQEVV